MLACQQYCTSTACLHQHYRYKQSSELMSHQQPWEANRYNAAKTFDDPAVRKSHWRADRMLTMSNCIWQQAVLCYFHPRTTTMRCGVAQHLERSSDIAGMNISANVRWPGRRIKAQQRLLSKGQSKVSLTSCKQDTVSVQENIIPLGIHYVLQTAFHQQRSELWIQHKTCS